MPKKGLPICDCVDMFQDYWLVKECSRYIWIQCKHCGEVRKTRAKTGRALTLVWRPPNWRELLDPLVMDNFKKQEINK